MPGCPMAGTRRLNFPENSRHPLRCRDSRSSAALFSWSAPARKVKSLSDATGRSQAWSKCPKMSYGAVTFAIVHWPGNLSLAHRATAPTRNPRSWSGAWCKDEMFARGSEKYLLPHRPMRRISRPGHRYRREQVCPVQKVRRSCPDEKPGRSLRRTTGFQDCLHEIAPTILARAPPPHSARGGSPAPIFSTDLLRCKAGAPMSFRGGWFVTGLSTPMHLS